MSVELIYSDIRKEFYSTTITSTMSKDLIQSILNKDNNNIKKIANRDIQFFNDVGEKLRILASSSLNEKQLNDFIVHAVTEANYKYPAYPEIYLLSIILDYDNYFDKYIKDSNNRINTTYLKLQNTINKWIYILIAIGVIGLICLSIGIQTSKNKPLNQSSPGMIVNL